MTAKELVLKYFPEATEDEIDYILWEQTGFPAFFGSTEELEKQIKEFKEKVGD